MSVLKRGVNDLATLRPDIASEWDKDRNDGLMPWDVTCGSEKKVWWKCNNDHSWQTVVYSRTEGRGCPVCAQLSAGLKPGINDLATNASDKLLKEWDDEANLPFTPSTIAAKSNRLVFWRCDAGHSWKASVVHRYTRGDECPYCSNKKVLKGYNDLSTTHPEIASEWDKEKNIGIAPDEVLAGTDKKIWWRCNSGHSWLAYIYSRKAGTGCPYCEGILVVPGENDLASRRPDIAAEWDYEVNLPLTPSEIAVNSSKKVGWICEENHRWEAVVSSRISGNSGCPYCSGRKVLEGYNDLKSQNPALAKEWHPDKNGELQPEHVYKTTHIKVWWKCEKGHSFKAAVHMRAAGTDCPYCKGKDTMQGFNDFATQCPGLCGEWDTEKNKILPHEINRWAKTKVWWKCKNGHEWKTAVADRTSGNDCPYCGNRKPVIGENDFCTMNPELMEQWNAEKNIGIDPHKLTYQSTISVWWRCEKGHEWKAPVYRRRKGCGCPTCARELNRHTVIAGKNDLQSTLPKLLSSWDDERNGDLKPDGIMTHSNRKVWWKCDKGHHWRATVLARAYGTGCPKCEGKRPVISRII